MGIKDIRNFAPSYEQYLQANVKVNGWLSVCFVSLFSTISGWTVFVSIFVVEQNDLCYFFSRAK